MSYLPLHWQSAVPTQLGRLAKNTKKIRQRQRYVRHKSSWPPADMYMGIGISRVIGYFYAVWVL